MPLPEEQERQLPGDYGQESSQENLPPIEAGTGTESAIAAAGEALNEVKAQEVQSLAEVLTRLNELEQKQQQKLDQLTAAVTEIMSMQEQAALALADIQQQKDQMMQQHHQHHSNPEEKTGIRRILNP